MRLRSLLFRFILLLAGGLPLSAYATHIVGADFTYQLINRDLNRYQIKLTLYQDCIAGDPTAISQDNPAKIRVYRLAGRASSLVQNLNVSWQPGGPETVDPGFSNACINNPPATCLKRSVFIANVDIPRDSVNSYLITYQRCCRNAQVNNIATPDATGATYYCIIPPLSAGQNSSAVFKTNPPQIICVNNPLIYDNSARDPDNDSLSYELCEAYEGASSGDPIPEPLPPPYAQVRYISGFSPLNPFPSNPRVQIDPKTGILTAKPTMQGRYIVTVCCHEWRNGVKINTTKREFQFVVTNCSRAVVADIPQYSSQFNTYIVECRSRTVKFDNISSGGFAYHWDFGVPGTDADTSNDFSPTFTYPDTGTYVVKLVVNPASTCRDSIERYVKVYPEFKPDFDFSGLPCPGSPIRFRDQSTTTYGSVDNWKWDFGDGRFENTPNPSHNYLEGGDFTVRLISGSSLGCIDTVEKTLSIEPFRPFAGNDTVIVKGESIFFNATGGNRYSWQPATYLNNPNIPNPVGTYPDVTTVVYTVDISSEAGCKGRDDIRVQVVGQQALTVPSAFTPNGDGINDYVAPIAIGFSQLKFFRIFNRFGEMVFETKTFGEGWDGYLHGRTAEIGTYYWVMSTIDRYGKEEISKGDLTLLR